ncbi:hypothetical protein [Pseudobacteriovorax antillogorgiicola]|uniref:Uncharacterized protein n=1 Tax=Pseudobacteriovorax antillogorgiicola TaxID=1513793 RepID=A0A1Y6CBN3_9BACT|nr:hypothetical protein [Pseudobacteriovorax antillogorgiicola]TCS48626.1 hypothetical protein EDD56_11748 [Pseudobacteriovorax antillogorgiicola]SMF55403.1 hypothetical protein SAMN06296036_117111 [Pseudobacteriovorax antillogorgiicola]
MNKLIIAALVLLSSLGLLGLLHQSELEQVSPPSESGQLTPDPQDIAPIAEPEYQPFEDEQVNKSNVFAEPRFQRTTQDYSHVKNEVAAEKKFRVPRSKPTPRNRLKPVTKADLDEPPTPVGRVAGEKEITTASVVPKNSHQEFRKKWLPIPSSTLDKFDRSEEIETCRNDICQPIGRRGVLLTGVVIQVGAFQGQIQPGNYLDQTPMLYLQ